MIVYIDSEYRCHTSNPDGIFREAETNIFDGKCTAFIEGFRYVPQDEIWARGDGVIFTGEMVAPWKPYEELDRAQRDYERELAEAARILLGEVSA